MKSLKEEFRELRNPRTLLAFIGTILFIIFLVFSSGTVTVNAYTPVGDGYIWNHDNLSKLFFDIVIMIGMFVGIPSLLVFAYLIGKKKG